MYRVAHFLIYAVVGANVVGIIDLSLHQPEMMIGEFQTQISRQARLLENKKILNMITIGIKRRLKFDYKYFGTSVIFCFTIFHQIVHRLI